MMPPDPELLKILCCPETRQELRVAPAEVIGRLNQQVRASTLRNRAGQPVTDPLDGGLTRADGQWLYPIRGHIPILLVDEAIRLTQ